MVLEGFRPGVAQRLGIDYATLRAHNPRLIYCAISGYGQDGPYRDRVGHDVNYLGYAGVLNFIGTPDGPPVIPGVQIADIGAGALMAAVGILAAVIAREQTGRGQLVDIAMLDGAVMWNVYHLLLHLLGQDPQRGRAQLTGRYAVLRRLRDPRRPLRHRRRLRAALLGDAVPPLRPRGFHRAAVGRGAQREEMFAFFRAAFREKTLAEWMAELGDKDICFGPVNTIDDVFADPQVRHRGMVHRGRRRRAPSATRSSCRTTPASIRTPPPTFGQHTDEVLRVAGLSARARSDACAPTASSEGQRHAACRQRSIGPRAGIPSTGVS